MKKLTEKQKKALWIVAAILVLIHFAPRIMSIIQPAGSHAAPAKPSPVRLAPVVPIPVAQPAATPEAAAEAKYADSVWMGNALTPDQIRCSIKLEIRRDDLSKKLKGYESESCLPLQPLAGGKLAKGSVADIIRETAPVSAVLTGTPSEGGLSFTVDQTVGSNNEADLTAFSIVDFGQGQVIAKYQKGKGEPQTMVLKKVRG